MSGGHEVDVGGEGSTFQITCFIIDLSLGKTPDVHKIASILLHQYKTRRFFCANTSSRVCTATPTRSSHPPHIICHSSTSVYHIKCKPKNKNQGGLGTRLLLSMPLLCAMVKHEVICHDLAIGKHMCKDTCTVSVTSQLYASYQWLLSTLTVHTWKLEETRRSQL